MTKNLQGITHIVPQSLDTIKDEYIGEIDRRLKVLEVKEQASSNLADGTVTNAKLTDMAQSTVKGRQSGSGTGDPEDLTATQLNVIVGEANLFNPSNVVTLGASSNEGQGQMGSPPLKVKGQTLLVYRESADSQPPSIEFLKRRSGTATVLQADDIIGRLAFTGADTTTFGAVGARIDALVDGTPGSADMPTRLVFYTTPDGSGTPAESFRINASQNIIVADGKRIESDEMRARDSGGLNLKDDGGNLGLFIQDGGLVGVGEVTPTAHLHVTQSGATPGIKFSRSGSFTDRHLAIDSSDRWAIARTGIATDFQITSSGFVQVASLGALSASGLALLDDGSNYGILINDGGKISIGGSHSPAQTVDIRYAEDTLIRVYNTATPGVSNFCGFEFAQDTVGATGRNVMNIRGNWSNSTDATRTSLVDFRTVESGSFGTAWSVLGKKFGIQTTAPQGPLHIYDGTGSAMFITKTGIVGSAQTLIANGTGDVLQTCAIFGTGYNSNGTRFLMSGSVTPGATTYVVTDGVGQNMTFTCAANGSVTVARSAGTYTWHIAAWLIWI